MRHTSVPFDVGSSLKATLILESDDELEHGVKVQVRVVADGEEQVVLQTNVEMMRCSSVPS
mgnify:CR=1 FL=1